MIVQPTILLDKAKCQRNIQVMSEKAKAENIQLRPHFKTHQSLGIGEWLREYGIHQATVSSLQMAEYFANGGWNDITVAFPINILEMDRINNLAKRITLNILILSKETIDFLDQRLQSPIHAFIKLDTGYHRTGVSFNDFDQLDELINAIEQAKNIQFKGFLHHAGHSYEARSQSEVEAVHQSTLANMEVAYQRYSKRFPQIEISVGDTPTCSVMNKFGCATEIRPGNFVFYDLMMIQISACAYDEIAVAVACPVVAKYPDRNEIVIYGGGVHFSKDVIITEEGQKLYGVVVENEGKLGWGKPIEGVFLKKLSQEHGTISAPKAFIEPIKIGDILKILPVHSCMTADLLKRYLTTEGEWIEMMRW